MRLYITVLFVCICTTFIYAQNKNSYRYSLNLNVVEDDEIQVELLVPDKIKERELIFHFPKIIPGSYSIEDFGRYINGLKAFDRKGKELKKINRKGANTWIIKDAKKLAKITYTVEDSRDSEHKPHPFEPCGTNIEKNKQFIINNNGFFGFFKGYEKLPFELIIDRPTTMFGSTSLLRTDGDYDTDIYKASNYHNLIDAPIMYCVPDTTTFNIGYGNILISVYSPNNKVKASDIKKEIYPILDAQRRYLGGILPVDRYAFIISLSSEPYPSGSVGALEHSRSSLFCLMEEKPEAIAKYVRDISAHEFFHIVTPLFIHSKEIHDFDYIKPKMSKHLWLYEGVTEYAAHHVQVKYQLYKFEEFVDELNKKIKNMYKYKDGISLVELSLRSTEDEMTNQYGNIYAKGSLNAMLLDVLLIRESEGKYDLQALMKDLSRKYGITRPFDDDQLFSEIVNMTYPQVKVFFDKYVKGTEPLPFNEILSSVGFKYLEEETTVMRLSSLGGIENKALARDSLKRFYVNKYDKLDEFGKNYIKFKQGDIIESWNGRRFIYKNIYGILLKEVTEAKQGNPVVIKVLRRQKDGSYKKVTLKTKLERIPMKEKNVLMPVRNPTKKQLALRKLWLGDYISESK